MLHGAALPGVLWDKLRGLEGRGRAGRCECAGKGGWELRTVVAKRGLRMSGLPALRREDFGLEVGTFNTGH